MDFVPDLEPTTSVPILRKANLEFAKAFKAKASPIQLMTLIPGIFDELRVRPNDCGLTLNVSKAKLAKSEGIAPQSLMWALFHAIPRDVLESMVLGTVAYDVAKDNVNGYDSNGSGVYVLGISISGRDGEFLNIREYATLLQNMKRYLKGCRDIYEPTPDRDAATKAADKDLISQVDNVYGVQPEPRKPRWVTDSQNLIFAEHFYQELRARTRALCQLDQTGLVHSLQSSQYDAARTLPQECRTTCLRRRCLL
ncbi:hypothetical protein QBC42DRAFT_288332 [Cladorrhinum samala]|uniref:Uncharacterized protein n=1 Tax=Cladorrhinum samala TaxID=585594 RepID=A0AAV9HIJ8_9PEZI|nr:hypothetical protein QBC42DRAFT_288332 [Cladorrhinum samala]